MAQQPSNSPEIDGVSMELDARMAELVAIGASVAGHCQPCLSYHVTKAKELGIEDGQIRAAISVGHMVEKGAMSAMREFARSAVGEAPQTTSSCCASGPMQNGNNCCG